MVLHTNKFGTSGFPMLSAGVWGDREVDIKGRERPISANKVSLKVLRIDTDGTEELCSGFRKNFDESATALWPDGREYHTNLVWKWLRPKSNLPEVRIAHSGVRMGVARLGRNVEEQRTWEGWTREAELVTVESEPDDGFPGCAPAAAATKRKVKARKVGAGRKPEKEEEDAEGEATHSPIAIQ